MVDNSRARKERQAAALRENLKRRKARARDMGKAGETALDAPTTLLGDDASAPQVPRPNPAAKNT